MHYKESEALHTGTCQILLKHSSANDTCLRGTRNPLFTFKSCIISLMYSVVAWVIAVKGNSKGFKAKIFPQIQSILPCVLVSQAPLLLLLHLYDPGNIKDKCVARVEGVEGAPIKHLGQKVGDTIILHPTHLHTREAGMTRSPRWTRVWALEKIAKVKLRK